MEIATGLKKVRQSIAAFSLVAMVMGLLVTNVANAAFSDVPSDAWYKADVDQLVSLGVFDSTKVNFRPGDLATRSEAVKTLVVAAGLTQDNSGASVCSDVPAGRWDDVVWKTAVNNGIASGYADASGKPTGKCGPTDAVTRGQFAKLVVNAFSLAQNDGTTPFTDLNDAGTLASYLKTAYYWQVMDGYADGTVRPNARINRAEIARMLTRALNPKARSGQPSSDKFGVVSANPTSASQIDVMFSMDLDAASGAKAANYSIKDNQGNNLPVTAAVVSGAKATLTTGPQTVNQAYTLTVSGITSSAGKALEGSTTASFTGYNAAGTGGNLSVSMDSTTPAIATLATKTANNTMLVVDLMGGSDKASQVTGLTIKKNGIYNDNSVKVVVYDANGVRLSNGVTFSQGIASVGFNTPVSVPANGTVKLWLKVTISGTSSGTLGISLDSMSSVATNGTVSGTFPIQSPVDNVVDGSASVAAATIDVSTISASTSNVDIGTTNYQLAKFKIAETSSKEDLKLTNLTLFNNGSTADGDIKNFTLMDQSGNKLATVTDQMNKLVTFDLSKTPYTIPEGASRTFTVNVDVMNGATRTAQLIVQNDFDVTLQGVSTGASILAVADSTGGTDGSFPIGDAAHLNEIQINEGSLTLSKANTSPSGDVTLGASDVVLGSFEAKAAGEDMELQRMKIDLSSQANSTGTEGLTGVMECDQATTNNTGCDLTGSVKLMVDEDLDGKPDKTLFTASANKADFWNGTNNGASLSNEDLSSFYTIPAGKTVNLMVVGSVSSNAAIVGTGESIKVGLNSVYYYKKSSLKYGTTPADGSTVTANALTVNTSNLTVSKNTSYGDQTIVSQSNAKVGSFFIKAGSSEGINVTSVVLKGATACNGNVAATGYTNVKLMEVMPSDSQVAGVVTMNGTKYLQLGTTKSTVTFDGSNGTGNTFSISGLSLAAGSQIGVDVFADMSSGALSLCTSIPAAGITGTGLNSITNISGPAAALNLQTVTAATNGTLSVSVANDTPVSRQYVAGSTDNQVLLMKLAANNAEDIYITKLTFRDTSASDDAAIAQATLKIGSAVNNLAPITSNASLAWQDDGTNPGFVEWTFSGDSRPKIVKNGTLYAGLYIDFSSSSQQTVSGKTPQFMLTSVEAQGLSKLTPSNTVAGSDLILATGITPYVGGTVAANRTFIASGDTTSASIQGVSSATTQTLNVTNNQTFSAGDIIFVDQNGNNHYDPATEELMVVLADNGNANTLTVQRGAFGTTAQASYDTSKTIYVLNSAGLSAANGLVGNANQTFNTKPTLAVASDSPTGSTGGASKMVIFKFNVTATPNAADPAENKVKLTSFDITTVKSGLSVNNLLLYPADFDNNDTYKTTCGALSSSKWRCTLNTQGATNEVIEGTTKTYIVRADVGSGNSTTNTLQTYIASLGTINSTQNSPSDVVWSDEVPTTAYWVYQPGPTEVRPSQALTIGANSGTNDTTAPTISSIVVANKANGTANTIEAGDTITLTWSEAIDPTSINAGLVPGGSVSNVAAASTGGFNEAQATAIVTLTNITTFDSGTSISEAIAHSVNLALDSSSTVLTITLGTITTGTGTHAITGPAMGTGTTVAGTIKDANGVQQAAVASPLPTGSF